MKKILIFIFVCFALVFAAGFIYKSAAQGTAVKLADDAKIDKIEVLKSARKMNVYQNNALLKTYKIALGTNPVGPKEFEGDGKTPEGKYKINGKNPNSLYHKNLGVSYPNADDIARAKKLGKRTGGDIKIHGIGKTYGYLGAAHSLYDWTLGCIAVTNEEVDEIYAHTPVGTEINIKP
ncbi:MAG: L,D-transpeptidase family protein [Elusimicrobium sp.]|jgi:murein L,D-transpeptidase YafK|nr:L,D-transpeptidase family protein [Elusimicrobium sp.]